MSLNTPAPEDEKALRDAREMLGVAIIALTPLNHAADEPLREVGSALRAFEAEVRKSERARSTSDDRLRDLLYTAWGVIANACGGNWGLETPEWRDAATRWRDAWHETLPSAKGPTDA